MKVKFFGFVLALLWVVADQWSKLFSEAVLGDGRVVEVFHWFNFALAYNEGAAFSLFANFDGSQRIFLSAVSVIASILIAYWIATLKDEEIILVWAFSPLLGGSIGNGIDRIFNEGRVIDFIQWHYAGYYFPTFNFADIGISIGAALLILHLIFGAKNASNTAG